MTAILPADLVYYLTTTAGAAGNTTAQADPNASLGKYASTTAITSGDANNLFDDITGDENAAQTVDYRCVVIANDTDGGDTLQSPKVWLSSEVSGGASVEIGLDPIGVVTKATQAATSIADETTAPDGVTFTAPTTKSAGLAPGDVAPGSCFALWVKRTAGNNAAIDDDGATFAVEGDTAA